MFRAFSPLKHMKTFLVIWAGMSVSYIGTSMTRFGLLIWAYQQSGSATTLALLGVFGYLPYVVASPFAGVLIDRWDRRKVILAADSGAAILSATLLALFALGRLELWHLYLYEAVTGLLDAFQEPANASVVTLLVPEQQLGRANGLQSLGVSGARVLAPALAGVLLSLAGLRLVLFIDLATFLVALGTLLSVRIPPPPVSAEGQAARNQRLVDDLRFGFTYIRTHTGLPGLLLIFMGINLLAALTYFGIMPAMVLARSGGSEVALGMVQTALGIGGVAGGLLFASWGGPRRRVSGYLLGVLFSFLTGDLLFGIGHSVPVWIAGALGASIFIPFIVGCYHTLWQTLVPADVQGRVFSTRNMLQTAVMPLGFLSGGLLADHVFEPAMAGGGPWVPFFGRLVGSGPGAGMGLMFLFTCLIGSLIGLSGYLMPSLRGLERGEGRESESAGRPISEGA